MQRMIPTYRWIPTSSRASRILIGGLSGLVLSVLVIAGIISLAGLGHLSVILITPVAGSVDVSRDVEIEAGVHPPLTGRGLDLGTVDASGITLYPAGTPSESVDLDLTVDERTRRIRATPKQLLAANTAYVFEVTSKGVSDTSGRTAALYKSSFRTGGGPTNVLGGVGFAKESLAGTDGQHTTLAIGPDGKLYAAGIDGVIRRWTINGDGTVRDLEIIPTLRKSEAAPRLLIGFAFDPSATAENLVAWAAHSTAGFQDVPDWGGKITRLSGANLEYASDMVVNLPRSTRDHATNGLVFGPDGGLYVCQGANTSLGARDEDWGFRPERLLSAAVLRVDVDALIANQRIPLDVKTDDGGTYDPTDPAAPVKIFASGIRNAYDLVWHSNGSLYVPNNGSAKGGRTPESIAGTRRPDGTLYSGPRVPSISNIVVEDDYLYRVPPLADDGTITYRYYGHPNPLRGEYAMNGGNPSADMDRGEVDLYPVGIEPDEAWEGYVYSFGSHVSPTGIIEYQGSAFNGALKGALIIAFYGGRAGGNIVVLRPDSTGGIAASEDFLGLPGLTGFGNPLDITEDTRTGFLYVSQMGAGGGIALLRPADGSAPGLARAGL